MKKIRAVVTLTCVLLVALSFTPMANAQQGNYELSSCNDITEAGVYEVTEDISQVEGSGAVSCVEVRTDGDVVINGNGHTIQGNGQTDGSGSSQGLYVNGEADVTVQSITISGFDNGVELSGSSVRIEDSELSDNEYGMTYENADASVDGVDIVNNDGTGVFTTAASFEATNSDISNNNGAGVQTIDGGAISMESTTLSGNGGPGYLLGHLHDGVELTDMTIENNNGAGIMGRGMPSTMSVSDSTITGNSVGIDVSQSEHDISVSDTTIQNNEGREVHTSESSTIEASNVNLGGGLSFESYGVSVSIDTSSSSYVTNAVTTEGDDATVFFDTGSQNGKLLEQTSGSWGLHSTYENTGGTFDVVLGSGTYAGDEYEMVTPTPTDTPTETPTETSTSTPTSTETEASTSTETETKTSTSTETKTSAPISTETSTSTETPTDTETETQTSTETESSSSSSSGGSVSIDNSDDGDSDEEDSSETETETPTPTETSTSTETLTETNTTNETNETNSTMDGMNETNSTINASENVTTVESNSSGVSGEMGLDNSSDDGSLMWIAAVFAILLVLAVAVYLLVDWEEVENRVEERRR